MRAYEFDPSIDQLDEDWKSWVAGAGLTAMALGAGHGVYKHYKDQDQQQQKPAVTQPAKQPEVKAPPQNVLQHAAKLLTMSPAILLYKLATKQGITGDELAQFLAQCAHESQNFTKVNEKGGKLDFRKYDIKYNPRLANILGNTKPGDGERYKGRGYIQLTGRDNYMRAGKALGIPLEAHPELLERPDIAAKVAVWYWQHRVAPKVSDFANTQQATKPINSGLDGLEDRAEKFTGISYLLKNKQDAKKAA